MGNQKERNDIEMMPDLENKLSRKRSQKEFEELLLKDILMELESGEADYWEQKAMELADDPAYKPTAQQRAAFEERLDLEVKRIQEQKRQNFQIPQYTQITQNPQVSQSQQESQSRQESQSQQEAKNLRILQSPQASPSRTKRPRKSQRILRRIGSIAAVLVLFIFMTMYHTVEAFAGGVDRFITTVIKEEGAEELRVEEKQGGEVELNMADYVGMYMPDWIPRGYVLSKIESFYHMVRIEYTNKDGKTIVYQISAGKHSWVVDDEEVVEKKAYVLDTWARVIEMEDAVCVVWEKDEYVYTVEGNVDLRDELIKMVDKCIKIE